MDLRILFVDDEPNILEGIRKALHGQRERWEMHFSGSAEAALEKLGALSFDVLVTDLKMPGMDGKVLMETAAATYPDTIRVVLTGQDEREMDLRKVPIAHHFLVKPCRADVIRDVIERTVVLRRYLRRSEMFETFPNLDALPKVPWIYASITKALSNPRTTGEEVTRILESAPDIAAEVLAFARARVIGNRIPPKSMSDAVMSLGFTLVKSAALSFAVFALSDAARLGDHDAFAKIHRHAVRTAAIAGMLMPERNASADAYLGAVLHDIGKWAIGTIDPDRFRQIHQQAVTQRCSFFEAEAARYPVSHAELGGYLLELWGLTYPVVEAVAYHHTPERIRRAEGERSLPEAVYIADHLENDIPLPEEIVEEWKLSPHLDEWRRMAAAVPLS